MNTLKAFVVLGPTAGGETTLALNIARLLSVETISLDSMPVYCSMDISTAKPTAEELTAAPHHLIDIISPLESYSTVDFVGDRTRSANEMHARGHCPLIVGGMMMYFHALAKGLNGLPSADAAMRTQPQTKGSEHGLIGLYRHLQEVDPITAGHLKVNDSQCIERVLEVHLLTEKPLSKYFTEQKQAVSLSDLRTVILIPEDRRLLRRQIKKRFLNMLEHGFLGEVRTLRRDHPQLHADMSPMCYVDHRQAWDYFADETDYESFVEKGIAATRRLVRRQLTWSRKTPLMHTLDSCADSDYVQTTLALARRHFQE